jgi:hypothetical protein
MPKAGSSARPRLILTDASSVVASISSATDAEIEAMAQRIAEK